MKTPQPEHGSGAEPTLLTAETNDTTRWEPTRWTLGLLRHPKQVRLLCQRCGCRTSTNTSDLKLQWRTIRSNTGVLIATSLFGNAGKVADSGLVERMVPDTPAGALAARSLRYWREIPGTWCKVWRPCWCRC